ncbi:MAG: ATP-binding protein [Cyclobacteriaceae bacterium]|nr:ATP-binding protein [Cyclobacteriaceae bacterium]
MRGALAVILLWITLLAGFTQIPDNLPAFEQVIPPGTIRSAELTDVIQDREGLIWVAANGLFSFDGYRFTHYTTLADSGSINNQEITCLLYDSIRNRILIGTRNLGIVAYNYNTNELKRLPSRDGTPIINQLALTPDGTVWVASFNSGLFQLQHDTLRRSPVSGYNSIRTSYLLPHGNKLYIGDQRKIFEIENNRVTDSVVLRWNNVDFTAHGRVTALCAANGNLYIGTEKVGMLVYNLNTQQFVKHFSTSITPFFNRINQIYADRHGVVWILTKAGGIVLYDPTKGTIRRITKDPLQAHSLSSDNCNAIIEDKTGIIWIAATGALNKYDRLKIQFQHITHDPNNTNSLSDRMVRCLFEEDDGTLLIGTDGGYINFLDRKNGSIDRIKITLSGFTKTLMPACIHPLSDGKLLIGTSAGMVIMDRRKRTFTRYTISKELENVLVRQILKKDDWLYILAGGALRMYNLATGREKVFKNFNDQTGNNPVFGATAIYIDSHQRIWVGAQGGVSIFNPDSTFTYFPIERQPTRPDGSYFMVLAFEEFNGYLWISSFNNGVWRLPLTAENQEAQLTQRVDIPELNTNTVYCTLPDKKGLIWMSSNQGILRYNPTTSEIRNFLPEEGVQALEFNRLAFLQTQDSALVLGGINGINIFKPEDIKLRETVPIPTLLSASNYKYATNNFYLNLRQRDVVELSGANKSLTINYLIPDYSNPRNYTVEYRLEGHDPVWIQATSSEATYPNLKEGNYTFRVRTQNNNHYAESAPLQFILKPPVWKQTWFIGLFITLLIGLTLGIFRIQTVTSRRNKERLEKLLSERTSEIEKSRAELQALNEKKDLIFSILSHDLRSPLTTLKGFLSLLVDTDTPLSPEQINQYARNIRNSVSSALDLIDNTLYWSLSQTGSINRHAVDFSVKDLLTKIYHLYQPTALRKRIDFEFQAEEEVYVHADENMVYVALRNVVSNAIKFTPEGKLVKLVAGKSHNQAIVTVTDQGIGMSAEYLNQVLNQQHVALKKGTANEKGTGLGLILCRKFIELNDGKLEIRSEENAGTEFRIYLPLANHLK